ncbi:hypothetical protein [Mycoplasma procyoni]|uniref:hypothetical protein n=1 Tax=Mycoplasma procyoni TaxID=568784 RepID=UPI00197BA042|nr:hypothetical protein [Mycoplasma procyoni]MBN3534623.1 hypothetical protein [Mycoplasma procyoni]
MKKKLLWLLPLAITPAFQVGASAIVDQKNKEIIETQKLYDAINYSKIENAHKDLKANKIALLVNENEFPRSASKEDSLSIVLYTEAISKISKETQIEIFYFKNKDEFIESIKKISELGVKGVLNLFSNFEKISDGDHDEMLQLLENGSLIKGWINFFAASTDIKPLLNKLTNYVLVGSIGTWDKGFSVLKQGEISQKDLYDNSTKSTKQSVDLVVSSKGITNTKNETTENSFLSASIVIATFSKLLINDAQDKTNNKILKAINSILNSAKEVEQYWEKSFNNMTLGVGAGILDYKAAWDSYFSKKSENILLTYEETKNRYEKEIDLKEGEELNASLFWMMELIDPEKYKYHEFFQKISPAFLVLGWTGAVVFPLVYWGVEQQLEIFKSFSNYDIELQILDGTWQTVQKSNSILSTFEKVSYKATRDTKFKIIVSGLNNSKLKNWSPYLNVYKKIAF